MKDIVIIPTYFRPEYLTLCLEHIKAAAWGRTIEVRVYHDAPKSDGDGRDSRKVFEASGLPGYFVVRPKHNAIGNTLNFLEAYRAAYEDGFNARYVYLIEDDVLVGPDFFDWHEAVQPRRNYFCSIAWHCIRNPKAIRDSPDPHTIVESAVDFSSIGVCWKREALAPLVRHAVPEYYTSPVDYLGRAFPDSPIPCNRWVEQAGLIMRLLLEGRGNRIVAWSGRPRVAHIGVQGYHRASGRRYSAAELRKALEDGSFVAEACTQYDDINVLPEFKPWDPEDVYVAQKF